MTPTQSLSLVHGLPLAEEPGIGALTIAGFAREVLSRYPEREALVMHGPEGRVSWSYAELWDQSRAVARALIAIGIAKDARIGILMTNRPEYIASVFGIAMAGGVSVPLSTFSTASELEYLLLTSCVSLLFYDRQVLKTDFGAMIEALDPATLPFLAHRVVLDSVTRTDGPAAPDGAAVESWEAFLARGNGIAEVEVEARAATANPSDVGTIFFSSGTTSLPKGIIHAQRAVALQWWRWRRNFDIDPVNFPVRAWTGNGLFWSGNLSMMVGMTLPTGGTIVLQPVFQADEALELMEKERISYPNGRPHQWARLQESPRWATVDLSSLHYITYDTILSSHPTVKTDWKLCPAFGTTETLTICTTVPCNTPFEEYRGSYGRPLAGNLLKIFDPMTGEIVPQGERGEIGIKGPTLMLGYIGKTIEETFDEDGYFCTGDGGYVDEDGQLFWEGRLTELIKTGGANVSPIEIDIAIAAYPGVKLTMTVGVPDDLLGEKVVACIVPHDGQTLDPAAITAFLRERFAAFKVPREILFFEEADFAVTGSGKIKFQALREIAAQRLAG